MKLKRRHNLSFEEADALIEKYYDGLTSGEEEKHLHEFLAQRGLPERYKAEQAIFGYFERKKHKPALNMKPVLNWASGIAAMLVIAAGLHFYTTANTKSNYAYVNGVKITKLSEVKSKALMSLNEVSATNNEVEQCFQNMTANDVVQQQLDIFATSEK
ncbi:MAG: hypothetical protein PHH37_11820 [Paludibacter sp.]|nr:hypothetical protein [Paludibacter sp.]